MLNRRVVVLANTQLFKELNTILSAAGWQMLKLDAPGVAQRLSTEHLSHAGLVELTRGDSQEIEQLEALTSRNLPWMEWIILSPPELLDQPAVCRLMKDRFYDYHTLPINAERLLCSLGHAYGKGLLSQKGDLPPASSRHGMIGSSRAMTALYHAIDKTGAVDLPVLITGESGTGKELAAHAIHQLSGRREAPFVAVNCAALPANLIQSELFGYEKGAFTGAHQTQIGRLEAAAGGTIFLDEIGDIPQDMQVNLLRVLQNRTIERLGSHREIHLDVRVIAASHVDLEEAVKQGRFREDLFYRLNVLRLRTPPLRERTGDITLLAKAFLDQFTRQSHSPVRGFGRQTLGVMENYAWPGNVRELLNRVGRAAIMAENRYLTPEDLGLEKRADEKNVLTLEQARVRAEHDIIHATLRRNQNNMTEAARQLGVSRTTLYRLLGQTSAQDDEPGLARTADA